MRIDHHLRPATLHAYLEGRLPEALRLVAQSHVSWCPTCRRALEAGTGSDTAEPPGQQNLPVEPARRAQTQTKARLQSPAPSGEGAVDGSDTGLPVPLTALLGGHGLDELRWRKVLPGVGLHRLALHSGGRERACLVRLVSGKSLPMHAHPGAELTLVLRGSYRDQLGRYTIGDVADLEPGASHRPVAESDCICLIGAENPARYRSLLARVWQLFVRP